MHIVNITVAQPVLGIHAGQTNNIQPQCVLQIQKQRQDACHVKQSFVTQKACQVMSA